MSYPALRVKLAVAGSGSTMGIPGSLASLALPDDLQARATYDGPAIATVVLRLCHSRSPRVVRHECPEESRAPGHNRGTTQNRHWAEPVRQNKGNGLMAALG